MTRSRSLPADLYGIGLDEAGRGCLAGPVVAAAVLFPEKFDFADRLPGLNDSKRLSAALRLRLAAQIPALCLAYGIGLSWQDEIDSVNILNATFRAMSRALLSLAGKLEPAPPALPLLLIDGNKTIPEAQWLACTKGMDLRALAWEQYLPLPLSSLPERSPELPGQLAIVGGDALVPCISAASILAKTVRDGIMQRLDAHFPGYGLAGHKGYGTSAHREAIKRKGPCALHRKTFRGVRPESESKGNGQLRLFDN